MKKSHYNVINQINSHRSYALYFSHANSAPVVHSIQDILNYSISEDHEWAHALCDILDDVLDLVIGESLTFNSNRDDHDKRREVAIIRRLQ